MSWEQRRRSKTKYFYRSARVEGKVTKQYIGRSTDPVAQIIAKADRLGQADRSAAGQEAMAEQVGFRQLEPLLFTITKQVRDLVGSHLSARGYRRQKGIWIAMKNPHKGRAETADEQTTREVLEHLTKRANRGDRDAADQLRGIIQADREIWSKVGDLTKHAETSLIDMISTRNFLFKESLRLKADELRKSQRGETADSTTEQLLIDHLVVTWLELQFTRMAAIQLQQNTRDARYWEQRHERADARYLAAIKELASVRRLLGKGADVVPMPDVTGERESADTSPCTHHAAGTVEC